MQSESTAIAIWAMLSDAADVYDVAGDDLLEGASFEILLALAEARVTLSPDRRAGLLGVGALLLRLSRNADADRAASTARMMIRLGISGAGQLSPGNR